MMNGVYQGRHIGEEVAGMGSPCGWGDVLLLLDILLLLEVLLLMELAVETLREDDDDDVDGAGLSAPAEEYPLEVVDNVGEAWG